MTESVPVCLILLAEKETADPSRFEAEVEGEGRRLRSAAGASAAVTVAFSLLRASTRSSQPGLDLSALDGLATTGLPPSLGTPIDTLDAVLEIRGHVAERWDELVEGLAGRLPSIEAGRSLVATGQEYVVNAGEAPVRVFYCLNRTSDRTPENFSKEWLEGLTKHTRHTPGMSGYRQLHLDRQCTALAEKAAGTAAHDFDGVALEWYVDLPFLLSAIDWVSEPGSAAAAAEQSLIDFSSARAMLAVNRPA
jgi:hypothetical protein